MGKGTEKSIFRLDSYMIPGYAGHIPLYRFKVGGTFAQLTQDLYTENAWDSKQKVLSPVGAKELQHEAERESQRVLRKEPRLAKGEHKYIPDMKSGYSGVIPYSADKSGRPFPIESLLALAEFENNQKAHHRYLSDLDLMVDIQDGKIDPEFIPRCVQFPPKVLRYGAPLDRLKANPDPYKPLHKRVFGKSVYDMDNGDPDKYIKSGYAGHIPITQEICGKTNKEATHEALNSFRDGRPFFRPVKGEDIIVQVKTSDVPVPPDPSPRMPPPPTSDIPEKTEVETQSKSAIFPVELGLIPHYAGHLPGYIHLCGMNFGEATKELSRRGCPNPLNPRITKKSDRILQSKDYYFPYFNKKRNIV